ncbi:hypothetical protein Tco_0800699, partial [Tanacetum coccineum]
MMCHNTTLASDTSIDFSNQFFYSIGEIVTHWFILIVLSALRRSGKENMPESDESDTYVLERFDTSARNPIKEILLKLNLPDHRSILTDSKILKDGGEDTERLSRSDEVLKLKNFKKDATLKLFKSTNPRSHKFTRWQSLQDGETRLCLVDDLK